MPGSKAWGAHVPLRNPQSRPPPDAPLASVTVNIVARRPERDPQAWCMPQTRASRQNQTHGDRVPDGQTEDSRVRREDPVPGTTVARARERKVRRGADHQVDYATAANPTADPFADTCLPQIRVCRNKAVQAKDSKAQAREGSWNSLTQGSNTKNDLSSPHPGRTHRALEDPAEPTRAWFPLRQPSPQTGRGGGTLPGLRVWARAMHTPRFPITVSPYS